MTIRRALLGLALATTTTLPCVSQAVLLGGGGDDANTSQSAPAPFQSQGAQQQGGTGSFSGEQLQSITGMDPEQIEAISKQIPPDQAEAIAQQFRRQMQQSQSPQVAANQPAARPTQERVVEEEVVVEEEGPSPEEIKNQMAFDSLVNEVLPLSPDQIKRLHRYYDLTLQAKAATPTAPPTPQFSSIQVNLDPGSSPPVIRLSAGFVSSLLFVDSSGEPWNIVAYSIGDPKSFNIQWDQKSNALFVQSMKPYSHGNLAIRLHELDTPVMLTLVSGQRQVDFRVDLQIPGRGPNAKPAVVETALNANVNPILLNILDGVPPVGSIKLGVFGGPGDAWLRDDKIYFRTRLTVLSPAWLATVSSADGMHVYELMVTPYVMGSENGRTVNIKLSGL